MLLTFFWEGLGSSITKSNVMEKLILILSGIRAEKLLFLSNLLEAKQTASILAKQVASMLDSRVLSMRKFEEENKDQGAFYAFCTPRTQRRVKRKNFLHH